MTCSHINPLIIGGADTPHIQILGDQLSADRCLAKCCSLGPEACQYLWIIDTTCIAVACDSDKISNCEPKSVPISIRKGSSSVYVALKHSTPSANELENALDLMSRFSSDGSKGKEDVLGDSPPIAATLTDEIVITLPTNEVNIFGNHSKDDKVRYTIARQLNTTVVQLFLNCKRTHTHVRQCILSHSIDTVYFCYSDN